MTELSHWFRVIIVNVVSRGSENCSRSIRFLFSSWSSWRRHRSWWARSINSRINTVRSIHWRKWPNNFTFRSSWHRWCRSCCYESSLRPCPHWSVSLHSWKNNGRNPPWTNRWWSNCSFSSPWWFSFYLRWVWPVSKGSFVGSSKAKKACWTTIAFDGCKWQRRNERRFSARDNLQVCLLAGQWRVLRQLHHHVDVHRCSDWITPSGRSGLLHLFDRHGEIHGWTTSHSTCQSSVFEPIRGIRFDLGIAIPVSFRRAIRVDSCGVLRDSRVFSRLSVDHADRWVLERCRKTRRDLVCFPLGLFYMLIKRAVDKYNIVFVYDTEIADKSVHRLAGNFIIVALIIQQLTLLFFVLVRSGTNLLSLSRRPRRRMFPRCRLESLNYLSMTLLGSFILTSEWFPLRTAFGSSLDVGGVYCGFSCFDCCGRWRSFSRSVLPEVKHFLFFFATLSKLTAHWFQNSNPEEPLENLNETSQRASAVKTLREGRRRFDWFCSFEELSSQRLECVYRRIRSSTKSNTSPSKSGECSWQLWNERSIGFSTDCCRHRRWKWSSYWLIEWTHFSLIFNLAFLSDCFLLNNGRQCRPQTSSR